MKKAFFAALMCATSVVAVAQDTANDLINKAIKKGLVVLRQDYQVLNDDDEPIGNKPNLGCYGRTYTCGVRIGEHQFLVTKDFVTPWSGESIAKSDKRHPEVSYSGFLALNTIDFEQFEFDAEDAEETIQKHLYTIEGSETEGFKVDEAAGKKSGYAVWLKSSNAINTENVPTGLSIEFEAFNVTTRENNFVYDLPSQPKGNVLGGVFIVPDVSTIGTITLCVNGMFEKRGGVWKLISLGKEGNAD